jgi:hypothetical protein
VKTQDKSFQTPWHISFTGLYLLLVYLAISWLDAGGKLRQNIPTFDFIVLVLATFRLIRLFVYDSVTSYIREYLGQYLSGARKELSMLINCPWCTGIWMALIVFFLYFAHPLFWYFLLILALAGAGSFFQIVIWKIGRE